MTLVAPRKPPAHHKKAVGRHHRPSKTYHKPYWPYLPLIAIVIVGLLFSNSGLLPGRPSVLSYATEMSIQGLLDSTNSQRISNGIGALALNGTLDTAAQAKANDMAARDYWSHNTPDGKAPWTFMDAAGYSYQLAGENLAYGFTTTGDTLTGWMNSPGHRANILNGGYTEVGFGFIDIANFQGSGPETLVVAMYGAPANAPVQAATPTPAAVKKTITAVQSAPTTTTASSAGAPAAEPTPVAEESAPAPTPTDDTVKPESTTIAVSSNTELKNIQEPAESHVNRSQILTAGKAPWSGLAVSLIGAAAISIFLFRHAIAWRKVFRHGEELVLEHPVLDSVFVTLAVLAVILSHSAGVIR
ncbi:hypothetical protein H7097_01030 [Aeromicrobium sp.]|nr:hypothetical protein [Candidatus Saccharibacteria bacterium]